MKKIKIMHSADLHFDTPFNDVDESQSKLNREELKEVFNKIINICNKESVDIFLLAGDIFDNYTINKETIHFIEVALGNLKNTKVFVSSGNHDPYGNKSFYKLVNWPENVHIFKGDLEKIYIEEFNTNVWGIGFTERHVKTSMMKNVVADNNSINLMVIHGELSNSENGNSYNPILLKDIENSNMDYIALGHRHGYSGIKKEGNTYYAYSGCPQGRGFDELGDKGVILGYVTKGAVDLNFIKTSKRNYIEEKIDISNTFGYEEICNLILDKISEESRKVNFYKIVLYGEVDKEFKLDADILENRLKDKFYFCKIKDSTSIKLNLEEISKGYSVKSIFVKKMLEKIENAVDDEEKEVLRLSLKLGLSTLSEGVVKADDY